MPLGGYRASMILIRVLGQLDEWLGWIWNWTLTPEAVRTGLQVFIGAMPSFIAFTFGSLLVAIQVASAQLTPRIIATTLLRDNPILCTVTLFVLTMAFAIGVLVCTETQVPYLLLTVALVLTAASIAAFLDLIDYAARLLRPVSIVWRVGEEGLKVLEDVHPARITVIHTPSAPTPSPGPGEREIVHRGTSGIVLAVDLERLRQKAERTGGVIEVMHRVGNFVSVDEPIFQLHGGAALAPLLAVPANPRTTVMIALGVPITLLVTGISARWLQRRHI